jgi:hypothetical protein
MAFYRYAHYIEMAFYPGMPITLKWLSFGMPITLKWLSIRVCPLHWNGFLSVCPLHWNGFLFGYAHYIEMAFYPGMPITLKWLSIRVYPIHWNDILLLTVHRIVCPLHWNGVTSKYNTSPPETEENWTIVY